MKKNILKLLYRSFDERLLPKEQMQLDNALAESSELHSEKENISELRTLVSDSTADSFAPFFAERVMRRIESPVKVTTAGNGWMNSLADVFRPLAVVAALLIIVLLTYNLGTSSQLTLEAAFGIPEYTIENFAYATE